MRIAAIGILFLLFCALPAAAQIEHDGWLIYSVVGFSKVDKMVDGVGLVKVDGGQQRTVGGLGTDVFDPVFAPDGKRIIFSRLQLREGTSEIAIAPLGGGTSHVVKKCEGLALAPMLSPDQKTIAYGILVPKQNGATTSYLVSAEGGDARPVGGEGALSPRWTPDGQHLMYLVLRSAEKKALLFVAAPDGSSPHPILESDRPILAFSISPDSKRVAYIEYVPGNNQLQGQIFTIDIDGGHKKALTPSASPRMGCEYSADGKSVYTTLLDRAANTTTIVRVAADGKETAILKSTTQGASVLSGGIFYVLMAPSGSGKPVTPPPAVPSKGDGL